MWDASRPSSRPEPLPDGQNPHPTTKKSKMLGSKHLKALGARAGHSISARIMPKDSEGSSFHFASLLERRSVSGVSGGLETFAVQDLAAQILEVEV